MATTTTHITGNGDTSEAFEDFVADMMAAFDGHLVSQSRAVDVLLDCYNASGSDAVRELVGEYLSEIQHLSAVTTDELRDMVGMVCIAAEVDGIFDHYELGC